MPRQTSPPKRKPASSARPVVRGSKSSRFSFNSSKIKIIAAVFILVVGGFGAWKVMDSRAAGLTKLQCNLLGRPYGSETCYRYCQSGAGSYITSQYWGYCSEALSTGVGSTKCTELNRTYLFYGCTRRWVRTAATGVGQCRYSTYTYIPVTSGYDYCRAPSTSGGTTTTTTTSSSWTWPVSGYGMSYGYSTSSPHYGIDIGAPNGTAVRAVASGTIKLRKLISSSCGYGLVMQAKLPNGTVVYPVYQHLKSTGPGVGSTVSAGQVIGYVDYPGYQTTCRKGANVHIGIQNTYGEIWDPWNSARSEYFTGGNPCNYFTNC